MKEKESKKECKSNQKGIKKVSKTNQKGMQNISNAYFPLETNIPNNVQVSELISRYGPKGFGVYIMLLTELRLGANYRYNYNAAKILAKRCNIGVTMLNNVIFNFGLFELNEVDGTTLISSPYLDRVMKPYDKEVKKQHRIAMKEYDKAEEEEGEEITEISGGIEKNRIEKNITTTAVVVKNEAVVAAAEPEIKAEPQHVWEGYLHTAMKDEIWVELLAMNSGISRLFMKHRAFVTETFRQHVMLQGRGSEIFSVADIKSYFANFLRQGTPTQKRVAELLAEREEQLRQASTNPHETIDPQTGQRSYFGNLIPSDAPPRPNANAVWSNNEKQWI